MLKPKIILRADGDAVTGLGHIMRLKTLGIYIKDIADIIFITKTDNKILLNDLNELFEKVIQIDKNLLLSEELKIISEINPEIIILDGYDFKTEYQIEIKKNNLKLVSLDDDFNCHYASDIIINHAPYIEKEKYSRESYTEVYSGFDYLLINPVFFNCVNKVKLNNSITINFGGADSGNLTLKYLKWLIDISEFTEINVVTGAANLNGDSINEFIETENLIGKVNHFNSLSQNELAKILCKSEYSLCPSSTISYESLAAKCIVFSGISADNQINIYKGLSGLELIVKCGDFNQLNENEFKSIVRNVILKSEFKNQMIDNILRKMQVTPQENYKKLIKELIG